MKNLSLISFFSLVSFLASAQTFNEKTFAAFTESFDKNPVKCLQTETDPDFVFVGTTGEILDLKRTIAICQNAVMENRTNADLKIRQYGNTAIVTGHSTRLAKRVTSGHTRQYDELITYVFVEQDGKWLWASAQHSDAQKK
ncbi:MAG: nuclear transport factor 2 family protein [Spirosomataceae bacterium]